MWLYYMPIYYVTMLYVNILCDYTTFYNTIWLYCVTVIYVIYYTMWLCYMLLYYVNILYGNILCLYYYTMLLFLQQIVSYINVLNISLYAKRTVICNYEKFNVSLGSNVSLTNLVWKVGCLLKGTSSFVDVVPSLGKIPQISQKALPGVRWHFVLLCILLCYTVTAAQFCGMFL